ncbi:MAG: hypothetical protein KGZ97_10565 [Bacteroidetes bacterium]|nr:hypothetical protein [Bacteroidota bacterium]
MIRLQRFWAPAIVILFIYLLSGSCRDTGFDTDPSIKLNFSQDTLLFDTVFTTVGSSTKSFKVYNNHHNRINISRIWLEEGSNSFFRFNADGRPGSYVDNIEIDQNDSIIVYVEITVDPVNQNLPLIITDKINFEINGNQQSISLAAWGQDAIFIKPNYTDPDSGISYYLMTDNQTWNNELPYVLYGFFVVDRDKILTINEGTRIHLHNNSSMIFLGGSSIKVNGTLDAPVTFQGDRLEPFYRELPGQWGRIWLTATSKDHEFNYAVIKNGTVGLHVDSIGSFSNPTLTIKNSIIKNMSSTGLLLQGSYVYAENTIVANCGEHSAYINIGGKYEFNHCTFANYYSIGIRQTPMVYINNYYFDKNNNVQIRDLIKADFGNSIIYGSLNDEILLDFFPGLGLANFKFDHCLLKTTMETTASNYISVLKNQNPLFNNVQDNDYRLMSGSPAINKGNPNIAAQIPFDILGNPRTPPGDLGAMQYHEIED